MSWIKESEYDEYISTLDPYLKKLGAAEKFYEPEVPDQVFVGMVKFPSGLWFQSVPHKEGSSLHLWGEMDLPFYGFEDAGDIACYAAECCGYVARVNRLAETIEVWGHEPGDHHLVHFQYDRLVDVTRLCDGSKAANGETEGRLVKVTQATH